MGSSGTGNFSDYSGSGSGGGADGSGGGRGGGSSGEDPCAKGFEAELEEVARSGYFQKHNALPPTGTQLKIKFTGRLAAVDAKGDVVGYLPTKYNYVAACIKAGWQFDASVTSTTTKPLSRVWVQVSSHQ
jgi:hypothetical protein